jgi:hypothetical protein
VTQLNFNYNFASSLKLVLRSAQKFSVVFKSTAILESLGTLLYVGNIEANCFAKLIVDQSRVSIMFFFCFWKIDYLNANSRVNLFTIHLLFAA